MMTRLEEQALHAIIRAAEAICDIRDMMRADRGEPVRDDGDDDMGYDSEWQLRERRERRERRRFDREGGAE